MLKFYLALAILLSSYLDVSAQGFSGQVLDPYGLPVVGAHVKVLNLNLGTVTDAEGRYVLTGIKPGTNLVISAIGFSSLEAVASDTILQHALQPKSILLNDQITVTAMRQELPAFDANEAIAMVSAEAIRQRQSRTAPEALLGTPGVWVQKTNHGGGSPIIRGLVGNQLLLLVDGVRMNNATYRYGPNQYLCLLDPFMIDRIEATRGSGSVLYGSDALGGVVNVLSRTPGFSNGLRASGRGTGRWMSGGMDKSGRVEAEVRARNVAFSGGYSVRDFGELIAGGSWGTLNPTGYYEHAGDAKAIVRTGGAGVLTLAYQHHQQNAVPRYDQIAYGGYSYWKFNPQVRQLAYARWESAVASPLTESIRITGMWGRSREGVRAQKLNSAIVRNTNDVVDTWGLMAEVNSRLSARWTAQSGLEYYHDRVSSSAGDVDAQGLEVPVRGNYADGSTLSNVAVFSNHRAEFGQVELTAGARINLIDVNVQDKVFGSQSIQPNAIVGNLGVAYRFHDTHKVFVNANSGFRAPNIDDMSKFGPVEATVFEVPSALLSPERSLTLETGMKASSGRLSGNVSIFATQLRDLIDRVPVSWEGQDTLDNRRVYQKQNVGEARLYGVEASAEWMFNDTMFGFADLTYTYGENTTKNQPMRRIPPLFGKVGIKYGKSAGFQGRAEWLFAGEQSRLAPGDLSDARITARLVNGVQPGWNVVNLYAGYRIGNYSIEASFLNVFDEPYRVYGSGIDGVGRAVSITVSAGF